MRTLRLVARYADISNWFGSLDDMRRKGALLERCCAEVGRDPKEILRTAMAPLLLVLSERDIPAVIRGIPPGRLQSLGDPVTPEQAAERLAPYLEAGIGGFTFANATRHTPELIAAAGELKRLLS